MSGVSMPVHCEPSNSRIKVAARYLPCYDQWQVFRTLNFRCLMLRLVFIFFMTLRAIACPLFCVGGVEIAPAEGVQQNGGCHCGHCQASSGDGDELPPANSPGEDPCPCDTGCVCQVTPELNSRSASADVPLALDWALRSLETPDLSTVRAQCCVERHHRRFDLQTGLDVRLACASLLL